MESGVLMGAQRLIKRCQPALYVENNDPECSKRLAEVLAELNYVGYWSIHPHYNQRNFYYNTVNVWENSVWASNLLCVPKQSAIKFSDAEKFLGENDDWRACLGRMQNNADSGVAGH
jgi:hypothetical protein